MLVLLISPLRGLDPPCGDLVYTAALLGNPPDGVKYENYADALARGALVEHANRAAFFRAWKTGKERWFESWATLLAKVVNSLRRARWLFWEPFRLFSVRPGEYDLVHVHAFDCGFRRIDCPLMMGGDIPIRYLYTDARGYSLGRTRVIEWVERLLAGIFGVNLAYYWVPQVQRIIAPSRHVKDWYLQRAVIDEGSIDQVPTYLPAVPMPAVDRLPRRIGFIAQDFTSKGGPLLLEAFARVREKVPDAELVIVGSPPEGSETELKAKGIQWLPRVPRDELIADILPSFDVFAYPTRFDGMPLVLLEAMSRGVAVTAADYRAIPEMLGGGKAGLLFPPGDLGTLTQNLLRLLDPETNACYRRAAYDFFVSTFSADVVRQQLLASYHRTLQMNRALVRVNLPTATATEISA